MSKDNRTIRKFECFVLGFCRCGCGENIPIRNKRKELGRFKAGHQNRGKNNWRYNGGIKRRREYTLIYMPDHPYCNTQGYYEKHRWAMEKKLGRYLTREEEVHHKKPLSKGGTDDIENLMWFPNHSEHRSFELTLDMSNRYCLLCNGKTWTNNKGFENWYIYKDGFICDKCYKRLKYKREKK